MLIQYREPRYVTASMWGYHATILLCGVLALIDGPPSAIGYCGRRDGLDALAGVAAARVWHHRPPFAHLARPYAEAVALFGGAVGMVIWVGATGVAHLEGMRCPSRPCGSSRLFSCRWWLGVRGGRTTGSGPTSTLST